MWKLSTQAEQIGNTNDVTLLLDTAQSHVIGHHTAQHVQNVELLDPISVKYMTYKTSQE
jgi:hypothetical protein